MVWICRWRLSRRFSSMSKCVLRLIVSLSWFALRVFSKTS